MVNSNSMSDIEITQFNAKFTQYQGNQQGTSVRALLQNVLSNNITQDDDDRKVSVTGSVEMDKNATSAPLAGISTGETYTVSIIYGTSGSANAGLVTEIKIVRKSNVGIGNGSGYGNTNK